MDPIILLLFILFIIYLLNGISIFCIVLNDGTVKECEGSNCGVTEGAILASVWMD